MMFFHKLFYFGGYIIPVLISLKLLLNMINNILYDAYLLVIGLSLVYFFLINLAKFEIRKSCTCFLIYASYILLSFPNSLSLDEYFYAAIGYLLFPVYWYLFFSVYKSFNIQRFITLNYVLAFVIAILGYYQYFIDSSIFGTLVIDGRSDISQWNIPRISSIVGSPQVLGFYLIINYILSEVFIPKKNFLYRITDVLIIVAAILTGNRGVLLNLLGYVVIVVFKTFTEKTSVFKKKAHIYSVVILLIIGSSAVLFMNGLLGSQDVRSTFGRVLSLDQQTLLDQSERLNIYKYVIDSSNLLVGNGLGTASIYARNRAGGDTFTSESYIISILYELGIPGLMLFHIFFYYTFRHAMKYYIKDIEQVFIAIYINMIYVHVFFSIFIMFVWGVLFYVMYNNNKMSYKSG